MHAQIVLFDGFDPLDVIGPYEVLYAGGIASGGAVSVELVSAEGPREVVSGTGGLTLRATAALDPGRAGLVLLPGAAGRMGALGSPARDTGDEPGPQEDSVPALLARALRTELPGLMAAALGNPEVTVGTVCGGSLVLAMAGLLEGRHVTSHHQGLDLLGTTGAHAVRARVVDDGDLVSGAGVTSGLDLGLYLLEREVGPRIAHAVEELFAHERRGTVWRARGPVSAGF
ncbi:glutamine amidotransferase [Streptomyces eurocidicus]|uniref:Glutamine amidotransferase n=1 Tax=Streptomyces eurocidicus TaxID=66423 RepID=A0A2N8NVE7_STREU|nr:DJ-1/PfpI family protein [Streptomyces eurocidicus]MBB5122505.1 transcriptional regulator GlxA family with amidase domain [Streptomyces eurocidicus]MBF6056238.1 DJ-1/PfpI family protein [Streptomyces eurocidicus]PNE32755.1 glutamine amidotransferase [Streptomyces eurocidicus]